MLVTLATGASVAWIDWAIVAGYLVVTTALGLGLAGKQSSIRDFFLGGRKLPWYAVSGSIIATEISAVTFVIVPFIVFRPGGNFTYLQLGLFGAILSRIVVAWWLVPAYYKREIYSPYDYMGNQLGGHVRGMTTILFSIGGMLAQSARVYLTAEILLVVAPQPLAYLTSAVGFTPLAWAILLIAIVAIIWTYFGGMTTVIWTDAMLFVVFLLGAFVALWTVVSDLPGGWGQLIAAGWNATDPAAGATWYNWGKFTFFDFSGHPTRAYTIYTAIIASTWGGVGAYGTDQLIAQRMFCCKNQGEARLAIITSAASQVVTFTVAFVGVGLYAYYTLPLEGATAETVPDPDYPRLLGASRELYEAKGDRIFPIFIVEAIPVGFRGLILAGILAAAISSLTSILAALSQTAMSAFYLPARQRRLARQGVVEDDHHETGGAVAASRMFVLVWGVILAALAFLSKLAADFYPSILDLALAMAGYAGGALLAGFFLAFLPLRVDGRGYMFAAPLSLLCIFALIWHQDWAQWVALAGGGVWLLCWIAIEGAGPREQRTVLPQPLRWLAMLAGFGLLLWISRYGYFTNENGDIATVAWPWQTPLGSVIAFAWGYLLAGRREEIHGE